MKNLQDLLTEEENKILGLLSKDEPKINDIPKHLWESRAFCLRICDLFGWDELGENPLQFLECIDKRFWKDKEFLFIVLDIYAATNVDRVFQRFVEKALEEEVKESYEKVGRMEEQEQQKFIFDSGFNFLSPKKTDPTTEENTAKIQPQQKQVL